MKKTCLFGFVVVASLWFSSLVAAQPAAWPADSSFVVVTCGGSAASDNPSDSGGTAAREIVNGPNGESAILYYQDSTYTYFRTRIGGNPRQGVAYRSSAWAWGIDTDGTSPLDYDLLVVLDGTGNGDSLTLYSVSDLGALTTIGGYTPLVDDPGVVDGYTIATDIGDGSGHWYISAAVPTAHLINNGAAAGLITVWPFTSNNANGVGNDLACANGTTTLVSSTVDPIGLGAYAAISSPTSGQVYSAGATPTISGSTSVNATVAVTIRDVMNVVVASGSATIDGSLDWTYTPPMSLANGDYTVTAVATNGSFNHTAGPIDFTVGCTENVDCNDNNDCTTDSCSAAVCSNIEVAEGLTCTEVVNGVCDGTGVCVQCTSNFAAGCDDINECTADSCVSNLCESNDVGEGAVCSQGGGVVCDGAGVCVQCTSNFAAGCDDSNECTADSCVSNLCENANESEGTDCSAGAQICDGSGQCVACTLSNVLKCDDSIECTTESCDVSGLNPACLSTALTEGSACIGGVCSGAPTNMCVECVDDLQCGDQAQPVCDTASNGCVACLDDTDCLNGAEGLECLLGVSTEDNVCGCSDNNDCANFFLCDVGNSDACIPDINADSDGDGVADLIDVDDDNDGVPDSVESGGVNPSLDSNDNDIPDWADNTIAGFVDVDNNVVDDRYDGDGDGVPNHLDLDSDNDGIADIVENAGTIALDSDGDGRVDNTTDLDMDGLSAAVDLDDNDPGNTDSSLSLRDTDLDTIHDMFDMDSDDDTVLDIIEAGGIDSNNDGVWDGVMVDANANGFHDDVDSAAGGVALALPDTDTDGALDFQDADDDGDGIPTVDELGDNNNDNIPDYLQAFDVDGGVGDAGIPDGGVPDGGLADGGIPDGGTSGISGSSGVAGGAGCSVSASQHPSVLLWLMFALGYLRSRRRRR